MNKKEKILYTLKEEEEFKCMRGIGNTHAQNTWLENNENETQRRKTELGLPLSPLRSLVDWFDCTFNINDFSLSEIFDILHKYLDMPDLCEYDTDEEIDFYSDDNQELLKQSSYSHNIIREVGYRQSITYNHITVFYNPYGNNNKGLKLSMSGSGCRTFELLLKEDFSWLDFFQEIIDNNCNVTRLDLAIDDFAYLLPVDQIEELADAGRVVSRLTTYEPRGKKLLTTGESLGRTLNFGSPKSRVQIRLYEKGKQMKEDFYWNRIELELSNENAINALYAILQRKEQENCISSVTIGIIKNYMRVTNKEQTDSNKSRWTTWKNWEIFTNEAEKIKIGIEIPKTTIETKEKWIKRQPPKSLAQIIMVRTGKTELTKDDIENNMDYLTSLVYEGYRKLDIKDRKLVEQALEIRKKVHSHDISRLLKDEIINLEEYEQLMTTIK